jgi:magnesium-transporting ATPase (P-type)
VLLTGDGAAIAQAVGRQVGVDDVHAELLPDKEAAEIKALLEAGKRVAMIGNGISDAPALPQATVGVAMGSGTDVARVGYSILCWPPVSMCARSRLSFSMLRDCCRRHPNGHPDHVIGAYSRAVSCDHS